MATILAHITVEPGTEESWEGYCRRMVAATHELEPRMLRYEYWRGQEPQTYDCLLAFEDHRAFIEHQTSDHHENESAQLRDWVTSLRLEWLDPVQGAGVLGPTGHQDAPDDADELTRKYTDRYAAQVADWWLALRPST